MQVLGVTTAAVSARAVGGLTDSSACIYVLDPSASHSFEVSGGSRSINVTSANVVGGVEQCSNCTITESPYQVVTGATYESDPLAYVAAPTVGSCTGCGPHERRHLHTER